MVTSSREAALCFVCLGNICRSPTAAGVMRHMVDEAGLAAAIRVESAGTAGYHVGEPPDQRARAAGARRGIVIGGRARKFAREDWVRFDYVLAMDQSNYDDLTETGPTAAWQSKLYLLRSFDPASPRGASVPDPYYGGDEGFDEVLDLCLRACRPLLEKVRGELGRR
jgi:protein-tyrosine phosphatase